MSTPQHSPGPFSVDPEGLYQYEIEDANGRVIGCVYRNTDENPEPIPDEEVWANGRLFENAPALLELAKEWLRLHYETGTATLDGLDVSTRTEEILKKVKGDE